MGVETVGIKISEAHSETGRTGKKGENKHEKKRQMGCQRKVEKAKNKTKRTGRPVSRRQCQRPRKTERRGRLGKRKRKEPLVRIRQKRKKEDGSQGVQKRKGRVRRRGQTKNGGEGLGKTAAKKEKPPLFGGQGKSRELKKKRKVLGTGPVEGGIRGMGNNKRKKKEGLDAKQA